MDQEAVGNVVLLALVTLISVVQNAFFAFERVYTANQNCVDAYPTFLVVLWTAGLLCSQVPAAFAGLMYLFVRQKYFVGYLGERTQSTPGYIFGKRIILFLFLMSFAGILNHYLIFFFGSDFENYIRTSLSPEGWMSQQPQAGAEGLENSWRVAGLQSTLESINMGLQVFCKHSE